MDRFGPFWPWKIFGSVLWCLEVLGRVSIVTQWVVERVFDPFNGFWSMFWGFQKGFIRILTKVHLF